MSRYKEQARVACFFVLENWLPIWENVLSGAIVLLGEIIF
jgi:hypothetical protein